MSWDDYLWFLGGASALSALLIALAVWRLRSICTRDRVLGRSSDFKVIRLLGEFNPTRYMPSPSLEDTPLLWREWHRARPSRWVRIVTLLYLSVATGFSVAAIDSGFGPMVVVVNALQVSIGLLLLSVRASSSLAEERARGSLDELLTTPLSTREIVLGKWLGTYRSVPVLAVLPALVGCAHAGKSLYHWWLVLLLFAYVLCAGAAITSLGVFMATYCSRVGRAVGGTIAIYVFLAVGVVPIVILFPGWGIGVAMASPLVWTAVVSRDLVWGWERLGWEIFWVLAWGAVAVGLILATVMNFDRCLGRMEGRVARLFHGRRSPRERVLITSTLGWAAVWSVMAMGSSYGGPVGFVVNGIQVTAGLLLVSALAAASLVEDRGGGGRVALLESGLTPRQFLLAKWFFAYRLVALMAVLSGLVALLAGTSIQQNWTAGAVMLVYGLCAGAAFTSFGLAVGTWFARGVSAFGWTVGLCSCVAGGWLLVHYLDAGGPRTAGSSIGGSILESSMPTFRLDGTYLGPRIYYWGFVLSLVGACVAAALLAAIVATIERRFGRAGDAGAGLGGRLRGAVAAERP